jgi:multidrug efflux system membrane fusion protein
MFQQKQAHMSPLLTWRRLIIAALVVVVAATGIVLWRQDGASPPHREVAAVPVTIADAQQRDVPIYLEGLGIVQASNTVAVRSQIDGKLLSVNFVEGQEVHQGDTLATIDPRTLQAALAQAQAKKAQDEAQLVAAQKDLERFQTLARKSFETQQNLDQQQAKVDQLKATIDADQGAIESAQTQLSYATITAPFDGRVGFRQLDAGNVIHASDTNPLTVLTQIRPVVAIFTLPEKNLAAVREAMLRGPVPVTALDQDNAQERAQGTLLLIDNQIDQATGTIRLKAQFANADERLWPGEFIRARAKVAERNNAVTVPASALQRGPDGLYVWVVTPDNTADQRSVDATTVDSDTVVVNKGLAAGEHVVVDGQYRLQAGTRVAATTQQAQGSPGKAS